MPTITKPRSWLYYRSQFTLLALRDRQGILDNLAQRLEDAEIAMTIMRAKGYSGQTLGDLVKQVPPASLKHS